MWSGRALLGGHESDGDAMGAGSDDAADDVGPVAVVLGVVGGIDRRLGVVARVLEGDVGFDAAGADAAARRAASVVRWRARRCCCATRDPVRPFA